jgi:uncharacterized membrane protein YcaP (DUF421 family)
MTDSGILTGGNEMFVAGHLIEVAARAILVYAGGFILIRVGKNRLLGRSTPFDIVLGIVLGSLLSRAINGAATVPATIAAAAALIGFHTFVSWLSRRSRAIEKAVKGRRAVLVCDGEIQAANMRRADISVEDLVEALRLQAGVNETKSVSQALLERNGEISVIRANRRSPHVIEMNVEDGVQMVRIELA